MIAVGLAGYALWGFVRAILDPLGRGTDTKGLIDRAGFLFSGISYAALMIPTVQALLNKPSGSAQGSSSGVPASLMTGPWGKWLVIAFGIFWIAAGAGQLVAAYTAHFLRDLKTGTMSAQEVKTATWLGQTGLRRARGRVRSGWPDHPANGLRVAPSKRKVLMARWPPWRTRPMVVCCWARSPLA